MYCTAQCSLLCPSPPPVNIPSLSLPPRSKQIESACFSGTAAFMEVRIQSVVVEFILNHVDVLFSSKLSSVIRESAGTFVQALASFKIESILIICKMDTNMQSHVKECNF